MDIAQKKMNDRREFLKTAGFATGSIALGTIPGCIEKPDQKKTWKKMPLTLRFRPYELQLKHAFNLATSSRTTTPDILTELEWNGITGYGEASLPPYLAETQNSVSRFLSKLDIAGSKIEANNSAIFSQGINDIIFSLINMTHQTALTTMIGE